MITRLFKKRGSSEHFKFYIAKAIKTEIVDNLINTF